MKIWLRVGQTIAASDGPARCYGGMLTIEPAKVDKAAESFKQLQPHLLRAAAGRADPQQGKKRLMGLFQNRRPAGDRRATYGQAFSIGTR
jgi:hypothetical protein